jgi:large subunit ribosomal protein L13
MSTTMPKPGEIKRVWYILDAADRPLGRTATVAASILRGKHKVTFTPHVDCGDHVIILNVDKAVLTGNKLEQKKYQRHTGYVGGLKETKYKDLMEKCPELAMKLAVKRMLPATVIGRKSLTRLRLFKGTEHTHAAQKPIVWAGK